MAKQGMKRPKISEGSENEQKPAPEIQGKAKKSNVKAGTVTKGAKPKERIS